MSNRNFDSRVVIQRLRDKNMAQNFAQFQQNGQSIINNPQTSDPSPQRIGQYYDGAGTAYEQNLLGSGYTVDLGATANFTPSIIPPSPPTNLSATAGNASLSIAFTAGNIGTGLLVNYEYSIDGGVTFTAFSPAQTASPVTISGLENGITYTIALKTVTTAGTSTASATTTGTPLSAPGAPTITGITTGNQQLSVEFTAPGSDGGSAITNYEYSTNNGSSYNTVSPDQTTSPIVITGLTNGTTYTIRLKAVNTIGAGTASSSSSGTPAGTPAAPTLIYSLPGDNSAYIYFTAGANGGSAITNYEYSTDSETTWNALSPADENTPVLIPGLTNGVVTSIQLRAVNVSGPGTASTPLSVTAQAPINPNSSLEYDPNNGASYSGSGTTVTNIGSLTGTINGTMSGGVIYQNGTGISRKVFAFDGNDFISFGQYQFGTSFTISAWVYPIEKVSINGLIANVGANQAPSGFKLGWNNWTANNRTMYYEGGNGSSGNAQASLENTVVYNTWQYLTYAIDTVSKIVVFLRNGTPVDTASYSTNQIVPGIGTDNAEFRVGTFTDGSYGMRAQLGYIKVLNGVTSVGDIQADYNASKASFGL